MDSGNFTTVLGHPRVLGGSLTDARHRVLAYDGDDIVGVGTLDPLFGHQAEAAIAVAEDSPTGLISYLFDGLLDRARDADVTVLRYVFSTSRQRAVAARLTDGCSAHRLHSDRLELHLERLAPSDCQASGNAGALGA